jgi:hypothetical protein
MEVRGEIGVMAKIDKDIIGSSTHRRATDWPSPVGCTFSVVLLLVVLVDAPSLIMVGWMLCKSGS